MSDEIKVVDEVQPDKEGKYPETVSWEQYVKTKETIGGKLDAEREKVKTLEDAAKTAINTEEYERIKGELADANTKLKEANDENAGLKDKSLSEKRTILTKRGVPEDRVKDLNEKELDAALSAIEFIKPGMDMGGSGDGQGSTLAGSPQELARRAYS